jgi:beta-barrel assembly-enhancing protease
MHALSRFARHFLAAAALTALAMPAWAQFGFNLNNINVNKVFETATNVKKATTESTEQEEIEIGDEFAALLLGAKPLDGDARLQRYVNTLGRWLALQTERPDLPWTFGVLDDSGFNAFATPGGRIFVTRGLINRMHSESELAGVLAHEIGHVLRKHHLQAIKKNAGLALGADAVSALTKSENSQVKSQIINAARNVIAKGLDKGDEFEADRLGVVIAARAGFDAYGLPAVLQMLEAQSGNDNAFSLMFSTHPSPADRMQQLDSLMGSKFDKLPSSQGKALSARLTEFSK